MATGMQEKGDTYLSISAESRGLYKESGSRFLAFAYPIVTEEEAKEHIAALRKEYFDARHHCFAWRLGCDGARWRANDDGEPSSTAGKPIYGQLLSSSLSDILIVVVRYFGGTKLGVPGLIRAYRSAAADAIANATIIEKVATETFVLSFDYIETNNVMKRLKEMGLSPLSQRFDTRCTLSVAVPLGRIATFREALGWAL